MLDTNGPYFAAMIRQVAARCLELHCSRKRQGTADVTAADLADVMQRFLENPSLRDALRSGVEEVRGRLSMPRFLDEITS